MEGLGDDDYRSLSRKPLPAPRPDSGSEGQTRSGRRIVKPQHLVPATEPTSAYAGRLCRHLAEANEAVKRTKTPRINPCQICKLVTSGRKNQLIACDGCNGVFHQMCHIPVIDDSVAAAEKAVEWFCHECQALHAMTVPAAGLGLVSAAAYDKQERNEYLQSLSHDSLKSIVEMLVERFPEVKVFPSDLISRLVDYRTSRKNQQAFAASRETSQLGSTPQPVPSAERTAGEHRSTTKHWLEQGPTGAIEPQRRSDSIHTERADVSGPRLPPLPRSELEMSSEAQPRTKRARTTPVSGSDTDEESLPSYEDMIAEALAYIKDPHGSTPKLLWEYLAE